MYNQHPPFLFVFNEKDYQANIWFNTDLFGDSISFITHNVTPLEYEISPETMSFVIRDKIGNQIPLNIKNHDMVVQLFKSIKIGIISGDSEAIKQQDKEKLRFTHATLK